MLGIRTLPPLAAVALFAPLAHAETLFFVSKTADSFDIACVTNCSLRETVYRANQTPGASRIVLSAGTYTLTLNDPAWSYDEDPDPDENAGVRGDLDISAQRLTILGHGQVDTIIKGSGDRLFDVLAQAELVLRRLTLRDGLADTYGGAVRNYGSLLAQYVSFINNRADAGIQGQGGALANFNSMTVSRSLFEGNNSNGNEGFFGRGGAIYNAASLWVNDTTFRGNSVTDTDAENGQGGALYNIGMAEITRSTFVANAAGVPLYGGGGSAIANRETGDLLLINSTISGNPGIATNGVIASGIQGFTNDSRVRTRLISVTVAGNSGLGVSNVGTLRINSSVIAGNQLNGVPANCSSAGVFAALALLLGTDQGNCTSDLWVDDALTWTKVLYPLKDNGGYTFTHALRRASPAIDATQRSVNSHDQRGITRPRDGNGDGIAVSDMGAYERSGP